jgi:ABC-type multidrug transport system ATPase subunit
MKTLAGALTLKLSQVGSSTPPDKQAFACDFARMLIRATVSEWQEYRRRREAIVKAVSMACELPQAEAQLLVELAESPRYRGFVERREQDAFITRFGEEAWNRFCLQTKGEIGLKEYSECYGTAATIVLLDNMLKVAAEDDGQIDSRELRRIEEVALELGVGTGVICQLVRKHDARYGKAGRKIPLGETGLRIGTSPMADLVLVDNQPPQNRAELIPDGSGWAVQDLGSERGTLHNGRLLHKERIPFAAGDEIRIGSYQLKLVENSLLVQSNWEVAPLSIRHLSRKISTFTLLDDISFTAFQGEVVAVVGPSGAGKTTLLNAIAGVAPADSGEVLYQGKDFHRQLAEDRALVGVVPQDDIVLPELTVEESLGFGGRLRFGPEIAPAELMGEVDRVLNELGINHIRNNRIGDALKRGISGGQRKRVNLGQELLTRSTRVLFLDEPTSGLDPRAAQDIVKLVRQLADRGRIVFLVTHDMSPQVMAQVDHLMVLAPGGRLAWFGPPKEACRYFEVETVDGIFNGFSNKAPEEWAALWKKSPECRKYVQTRESLLDKERFSGALVPSELPYRRRLGGPLSQLRTLTQRYLRVKLRDYEGIWTLVIQPFIVAGVLAAVFKEPTINLMFIVSLSCLWFGMSAAVRELIADRVVWNRERRVGVGVLPYVGSKVLVLAGLVMSQCITLAALVTIAHFRSYDLSLLKLILVTVLTGWTGLSIGLVVSARSTSSEQAVGTLPLLLIPQITFSGLLVYIRHMWPWTKHITALNPLRYAFDAILKTGTQIGQQPRAADPDWKAQMGMSSELYQIGFKQTAGVEDVGIPLAELCGILLGISGACLLWTLWSVKRRE